MGLRPWQSGSAMKKLNRFILGLVSSLLFIAGFARAAEHCDPMAPARGAGQVHATSVAPDTTYICALE